MARTRREVLKDGATVSVAFLAAGALPGDVAVAVAPGKRFLDDAELAKLRGAVDVFVPSDQDPGALEAGCADAIDALLAAFEFNPPRIYAGAPFSDRGGAERNSFKRFLPLDAYERRAWRLRIRGSRGVKANERNGPVIGWQTIYREGLAALPEDFATRSRSDREQALDSGGPAVKAMTDIAWPHTWQFIYGAPEYGGNENLVGWEYTGWAGDVQPRGYTREEIESAPDPASAIDLAEDVLPIGLDQLVRLAALGGSPESLHVLLAAHGHSQHALEEALAGQLKWVKRGA